MNTFERRDFKLAPIDSPKSPVFAFIGKAWGNYMSKYWTNIDTVSHSANVRRGKLMTGALAGTVAVAALAGCGVDSAPTPTTIAPCVAPTPETLSHTVVKGETASDFLLQINGVTYGTCMETAKDLTTSPNGGNITAPRAGDIFNYPAVLIPAAEAATTTTKG